MMRPAGWPPIAVSKNTVGLGISACCLSNESETKMQRCGGKHVERIVNIEQEARLAKMEAGLATPDCSTGCAQAANLCLDVSIEASALFLLPTCRRIEPTRFDVAVASAAESGCMHSSAGDGGFLRTAARAQVVS
jgi:hypothetical protein